MDKTISIIISPHGFGHLTRQIALCDEILKFEPNLKIRFICNLKHQNILNKCYKNISNIEIYNLPLTPNIAMNDYFNVDKESTLDIFKRFWEWGTQIRDDREWERILVDVNLIINDIECIHNPIAKSMGIKIVNISNFTWSDIIEFLGDKDLANIYSEWEKLADEFIQLPSESKCLGFKKEKIKKVGLLVRRPNLKRVDTIKKISNSKKILIAFSKGFPYNLQSLIKRLLNQKLIVLTTMKLPINDENLIILDDIFNNFHDYVWASDLVIGKIGYGLVSEVISSGTPFLYTKRSGFEEDKITSKYIEDNNYGEEINLETDIYDKIMTWLEIKPNQQSIDNEKIAKLILKELD